MVVIVTVRPAAYQFTQTIYGIYFLRQADIIFKLYNLYNMMDMLGGAPTFTYSLPVTVSQCQRSVVLSHIHLLIEQVEYGIIIAA